ncbi:hypothetical protein ACFC14_11825 [Microbacterium sp. NPDC055988]|uniref:hypothetical protein n=1 Tax=Microbacterium sp. NPDC055988 TaxID=3345671 RepID=UPI0035D69911
MTRGRLADRDAVAFGFSALCACIGVLIWTLWVMPVAASVGEADPLPLGRGQTVELNAGERVGIWGSGVSAMLGTLECSVSGPGGDSLAQRGGPSLSWDDTLWWMTPKRGFEQHTQFTSMDAGVHTVTCTDSLDTYDGEFLIAGDVFGSGSIGLGRTGGSDFATGTLLAFGAVFCLPVAVLLPVVILIRRLVTRRRSARNAQRAGASWAAPPGS